MKIKKLKLKSVVSGIFILFHSCSEDDGAAEIFEEINAPLPSSIVLKNIPAGTFTIYRVLYNTILFQKINK